MVGRLVADGQGGLYAAPAEAVYITSRVGTYSVTQECTINLTITDGFLPDDLIAPLTPATVRFTGVLQSRGGESNLIQASGGNGTSSFADPRARGQLLLQLDFHRLLWLGGFRSAVDRRTR